MQTLSTVIEFVKDPNWSPTTQTGDISWIFVAILACIVAATVAFIVYKKRTSKSQHVAGNAIAISKTYVITAIAVVLLVVAGFCAFNIASANADTGKLSASDKIQATVNPDTCEVSIPNGFVKNETGQDMVIDSLELTYLTGGSNHPEVIWSVSVGKFNVYNASAPGISTHKVMLDPDNVVSFSVTGFNSQQLISLLDKPVLQLNYNVVNCIPEEIEVDIMPQEINYLNDVVDFSAGFVPTYLDGIDQSTKNHFETLVPIADKGLEPSIGIVIGTIVRNGNSQESQAEALIKKYGVFDQSVFDKNDGYQILLTSEGGAILARDTNAAYMAITTFADILNSYEFQNCRSFITNDWAVAKYRGFIEGYYGIPWSPENRLDLQEFGSKFKMNTYIFAPKDDEYHSAKWYEPYPDDKLAEMKQYVDKGIETKVAFAWAIHPFLGEGKFDWTNYERDKNKIIAKYEQLYQLGVRKFGLSADDMEDTAIIEDQVKLLKDLEVWAKSKGDISSLIFVPKIYNEGFIYSDFEKEYLRGMRELDDFFDIMWTGCAVMGPCETDTFNIFKDYTGHDAFMWMNFPVNDYCDKCLLMGKGQIMQDNVTNYMGLVSNPMQQAQASKVALYETAYYTWRNYANDTERTKAWLQSFKYVDAGAPLALAELCKHLSYWNGEWLALEESEELAPLLDYCISHFDGDIQIDGSHLEKLKLAYDVILNAITFYNNNHQNIALYTEIKPWLDAFAEQCYSNQKNIDVLLSIYSGNIDQAKALFAEASALFANSQLHSVPVLPGDDPVYAEPGNKRLFPFAQKFHDYLQTKLQQLEAQTQQKDKPVVVK